MAKSLVRYAVTALVVLSSNLPLLPTRLERPGPPPGKTAPAPVQPARVIGTRDLHLGPFQVRVRPAPTAAARGEWNDELQPKWFAVSARRVTTAKP